MSAWAACLGYVLNSGLLPYIEQIRSVTDDPGVCACFCPVGLSSDSCDSGSGGGDPSGKKVLGFSSAFLGIAHGSSAYAVYVLSLLFSDEKSEA